MECFRVGGTLQCNTTVAVTAVQRNSKFSEKGARRWLKLTSNSKASTAAPGFLVLTLQKKISSSPNDFDISRKHPFFFLYICELNGPATFLRNLIWTFNKKEIIPMSKTHFVVFVTLNLLDVLSPTRVHFGCLALRNDHILQRRMEG